MRRNASHRLFWRIFQRLKKARSTAKSHGIQNAGMSVDNTNEVNIIDAVLHNTALSTRCILAQLNMPQRSVWRILNREELHLYHCTRVHALQAEDYGHRLECFHVLLLQIVNYPNFISKV